MKDKILTRSVDMFISYGVKSVTMDEIAAELGISKKTIYQHFKNKNQLVEAAVFHLFDEVCAKIDTVCDKSQNPIHELYRIKKVVKEYLKDEKSSPYFQLKKYYPKLFSQLIKKQYEVMIESVGENLRRGMSMGYFRDDLDVDFISRIYFSGMNSIKDEDLFPMDQYSIPNLTGMFLEYHLRAIVTPKGLEELNQYIQEEKIVQ